jgi:hypothetical protein
MTSINNLTAQDTLSTGDLFPVWSGSNGDTRRVSLSVLVAFIQAQITGGGGFMTQYSAPSATGFSVTITPTTTGESVWLLLTPAAGYAAGTIVLPASPVDGQEVSVSCTQAVTTLTVSGNGATVNNAPTTLAAGAFFRMRYDGVFGAWYRFN